MKIEPTAPSDAAADPLHPDHDRWVKQTLVEDEAKRLHDLGIPVHVREIEDDVNASLARIDARKREGTHKRKPEQIKRRDSAAQIARKLGYSYERERELQTFQASQRCKIGCGGTCPRCKLESRIRTLCASEGRGDKRRFLFPHGIEIIQELGNCVMRRGDYSLVKTERERNKILHRKLENIADRSTALLGSWR